MYISRWRKSEAYESERLVGKSYDLAGSTGPRQRPDHLQMVRDLQLGGRAGARGGNVEKVWR